MVIQFGTLLGTLFKTNFGTALNCAPVRPWKGRFRRRGRTRRTLAGSRYRLAVSSWVVGDPFFLESPINIKLTVLFSTYLVVDTFIWSELVRPAKNANALHSHLLECQGYPHALMLLKRTVHRAFMFTFIVRKFMFTFTLWAVSAIWPVQAVG